MNLEEVREAAAVCTECALYKGRKKPVFDKGNPDSHIFICGMVPAKDENEAGIPFVGRAGKLLDEILEDVGISLYVTPNVYSDDVYITNLVKCFLAAGKKLENDWINSCAVYLLAQIELLKPKIIIALGTDASKSLIGDEFKSISDARKKNFSLSNGIRIVPTYHPSYLLRNGGKKSKDYVKVIEDFNKAKNLF